LADPELDDTVGFVVGAVAVAGADAGLGTITEFAAAATVVTGVMAGDLTVGTVVGSGFFLWNCWTYRC